MKEQYTIFQFVDDAMATRLSLRLGRAARRERSTVENIGQAVVVVGGSWHSV